MPNKPVQIVSTEEPTTTVVLADGTVLKVRLAVHTAFVEVTEDGRPVLLPNGNPNYGIEWAAALQTIAPPAVLATGVRPAPESPGSEPGGGPGKPPTVN